MFIAPFTTCFGLTPALTSNPIIGSCTSLTLTNPYPLGIPSLLLLLADLKLEEVGSEE